MTAGGSEATQQAEREDSRVMAMELTWCAPGPGDWWLVKEHFPYSVSRMFSSLFPAVTVGWKNGGARY